MSRNNINRIFALRLKLRTQACDGHTFLDGVPTTSVKFEVLAVDEEKPRFLKIKMNDIQFATGWTELLLAWPVPIFRVFLIIGWTENFKEVTVFLPTEHCAVYYDRANKCKNNGACLGPHVTRSGILVQRRSGIVIGSVPFIYVPFENCDWHINHMYWPLGILVNHHSTTSSRLRTVIQLTVLVSVNT